MNRIKEKEVDLKQFRFSKLNDPEYSHLKLLAGWIIYFAFYFLTENLIPLEKCHIIESPLDRLIPFCEVFLIPYCLWYLYVFFSLYYFGVYDVRWFRKAQIYIMLTQLIAMTVYIIYPNVQYLRPDSFERNNIFTYVIGFIYRFDTSSGVCPSLHVGYSIALLSTWLKYDKVSRSFKILQILFVAVVCLSTLFIKQHSVVDVYAALLMCVVCEIAVYGKSYWMPKFRRDGK